MSSFLSRMDFGNEAADDASAAELASYFVEQESFGPFVDAANKLLVAKARKGVGKSALLQGLALKISQCDQDAVVIRCRGADLARTRFNLRNPIATPNEYIDDWRTRLCTVVNRDLAQRVGLALTDDKITLVETAELEGFRARNLAGSLIDRFQHLLGKYQPDKLAVKNELEMLRRVQNRRVWLLIDDLDATFQNTNQERLELGTFFSACRYLTQDIRDVSVRVTMRTDVWSMVKRFDESLDKMAQYVCEIEWPRRDFLELLYLRVKAQCDILGIKIPVPPGHVSPEDAHERLLEMVFEPKMEWGQKLVDSYKVIYTLSYERPRWAVQLCKLAKESALRHGHELISKANVDEVWGEYGTMRIADLVAEHKHQCPEVEELLTAFRGADRLMSRDALMAWINTRVLDHMKPRIEGETVNSPVPIAHFLYRMGFILARSGNEESYEHYRFDQQPDFLTSRTNEDFGLAWEIHPCYREALDIKKLDQSHRERFSRLRKR